MKRSRSSQARAALPRLRSGPAASARAPDGLDLTGRRLGDPPQEVPALLRGVILALHAAHDEALGDAHPAVAQDGAPDAGHRPVRRQPGPQARAVGGGDDGGRAAIEQPLRHQLAGSVPVGDAGGQDPVEPALEQGGLGRPPGGEGEDQVVAGDELVLRAGDEEVLRHALAVAPAQDRVEVGGRQVQEGDGGACLLSSIGVCAGEGVGVALRVGVPGDDEEAGPADSGSRRRGTHD